MSIDIPLCADNLENRFAKSFFYLGDGFYCEIMGSAHPFAYL